DGCRPVWRLPARSPLDACVTAPSRLLVLRCRVHSRAVVRLRVTIPNARPRSTAGTIRWDAVYLRPAPARVQSPRWPCPGTYPIACTDLLPLSQVAPTGGEPPERANDLREVSHQTSAIGPATGGAGGGPSLSKDPPRRSSLTHVTGKRGWAAVKGINHEPNLAVGNDGAGVGRLG